jgi:hypothetical protein
MFRSKQYDDGPMDDNRDEKFLYLIFSCLHILRYSKTCRNTAIFCLVPCCTGLEPGSKSLCGIAQVYTRRQHLRLSELTFDVCTTTNSPNGKLPNIMALKMCPSLPPRVIKQRVTVCQVHRCAGRSVLPLLTLWA